MTAQRLQRLAAACYLSLFALAMAWRIVLAPPSPEMVAIKLLVHAGPLLFALRGVLHGRRYTFRWSGMLILAYFIHGAASMADGGIVSWLGAIEMALSLGFFAATIGYLRKTGAGMPKREQQLSQPPAPRE